MVSYVEHESTPHLVFENDLVFPKSNHFVLTILKRAQIGHVSDSRLSCRDRALQAMQAKQKEKEAQKDAESAPLVPQSPNK